MSHRMTGKLLSAGSNELRAVDVASLCLLWHDQSVLVFIGRLNEVGDGAGEGTTINLPLPGRPRSYLQGVCTFPEKSFCCSLPTQMQALVYN